jgi:predicted nucleotidyltransferase
MTKTRKGYVVYPDTNGLLHNSLYITQTQPHWLEAAEAFVSYFEKTQHPNIDSIYLRGSAACGNAIDSFSDIDFYTITQEPIAAYDVIKIAEFARKLNRQYPFITKFDVGYYTKNDILHSKEGALLKVTALCMYGKDISSEISAPRVGKDMTLSISQMENDIVKIKSEVMNGIYEDPEKLRQLCIWISKKTHSFWF